MQKKLSLIIGVALGILGAALIGVYLQQQKAALVDKVNKEVGEYKQNLVAVLVAKQDIPAGTPVSAKMLESKSIPRDKVQPNTATILDEIQGKVANSPIKKADQIILSKLSDAASGPAGWDSLASRTPIGKRATAVSVDNISSLVGMIKPGDYVDVTALLPMASQGQQAAITAIPIFQKVLVLAVGQDIGSGAGKTTWSKIMPQEKKDEAPLITLALSPEESSIASFVQEQGKIRLTLRSAQDTTINAVTPTSWDTFFSYLVDQGIYQPPDTATEEDQSAMSKVEVYRGLEKKEVLIKNQ